MGLPRAPLRVWESNLAYYKHVWRSNLIGSFVQPMLYMLGMGVGVGALVDRGPGASTVLDGVDYFAFLAPALIATTAMTIVTQEALWPVMDGFMWSRRFEAMAATPVTPSEVALGTALWLGTRAFICAGGVAVVLLFFDDTRTWGLAVAVAAAVLTGMAFAMPIMAFSSSRESPDQSFAALQRFAIIPMFLFAGAFYPVEQLPGWLQPVAYVTPLWHGIELCRDAVLGRLELGPAALNVAALTAFTVVGYAFARRTFATRLGR